MKKLILFVLVLSLAPAMAELSVAKSSKANPNVKSAVVERFDKNDDGTLNKRERKVAANHRDNVVDRFDKNDNGTLDKGERKILRKVRANKVNNN
ncbi:MAG: hypothetical protein R3Y56_05630 [Akkermansia sp.]